LGLINPRNFPSESKSREIPKQETSINQRSKKEIYLFDYLGVKCM